jgi:hypothetical protein
MQPLTDIEIVAPHDRWPTIRDDPRFIEIMRLARATNALGLAYGPLAHSLVNQSPSARRERFAAFVYVAALLKEALDTAQSLGKWFRETVQYQEGFGALLRDPAVRQLRSNDLDSLRDKLVFHFDRDAIAKGLGTFPLHGDVRILSYPDDGPKFGETYFDAADDAVLGFLFGDSASDEEYYAKIEAFMGQVSDLLHSYIKSSHSIIAIALLQLGCRKKLMVRPVYPDEPVT